MRQIKADLLSIQDFAAALRNIPALAFDRNDEVFDFLKRNPVASDTLAPFLNWAAQHSPLTCPAVRRNHDR